MPLKVIRNISVVLAAILLGTTGLSVFSSPDYETVYTTDPFRTCTTETCVLHYSVEIGNSGRLEQPNVAVTFDTAIFQQATMRSVRTVGKIESPYEEKEADGKTTLSLGTIKPGSWKNISLTFISKYSEKEITEDDIQFLVVPSNGRAHPGAVQTLRFGRFLFHFIDLF